MPVFRYRYLLLAGLVFIAGLSLAQDYNIPFRPQAAAEAGFDDPFTDDVTSWTAINDEGCTHGSGVLDIANRSEEHTSELQSR